MSEWIAAALAFLTSAGFYTFLQFLIKRRDEKKGKMAEIDKRLQSIERGNDRNARDGTRTQMLVLMASYPKNNTEIMKVAEHYFGELKGDWYMTGLFNTWLVNNGIGKPEWFNSEG